MSNNNLDTSKISETKDVDWSQVTERLMEINSKPYQVPESVLYPNGREYTENLLKSVEELSEEKRAAQEHTDDTLSAILDSIRKETQDRKSEDKKNRRFTWIMWAVSIFISSPAWFPYIKSIFLYIIK